MYNLVIFCLAAEKVGLPPSPPYLSLVSKSNKQNASFVNGVSFASGGAGIFNGSDEKFVSAMNATLFQTKNNATDPRKEKVK